MAAPISGLLESATGGLPLVRDFGLNTKKASNFAGLTIDASGNLVQSVNGNFDFSSSTGFFKFPTGAITGQTYNVLSNQGAGPTTLTAAQSDGIILMDRAAGNAFVLPTPVVGLQYTFIVTVSVTSNAHEVVTDAGTTFLIGSVIVAPNSATVGLSAVFSGDGSTNVEFTMNGTTQGGLVGSQITFTCVSSTIWNVTGTAMGSGTLATPFTT